MSKPRFYWYGFIQTYMRRYDKLDETKPKEKEAKKAIEEALEELQTNYNGQDIKKIIQMVYFSKTHTLQGAALNICVSERTAARWVSAFTYKVGNKMGYK